jgi:hypothetical protein
MPIPQWGEIPNICELRYLQIRKCGAVATASNLKLNPRITFFARAIQKMIPRIDSACLQSEIS